MASSPDDADPFSDLRASFDDEEPPRSGQAQPRAAPVKGKPAVVGKFPPGAASQRRTSEVTQPGAAAGRPGERPTHEVSAAAGRPGERPTHEVSAPGGRPGERPTHEVSAPGGRPGERPTHEVARPRPAGEPPLAAPPPLP